MPSHVRMRSATATHPGSSIMLWPMLGNSASVRYARAVARTSFRVCAPSSWAPKTSNVVVTRLGRGRLDKAVDADSCALFLEPRRVVQDLGVRHLCGEESLPRELRSADIWQRLTGD